MGKAIMNQIELHNKIDELLLKNPDEVKQEEVSVLVSTNADAHQYFFAKADERWLDWLWENGFLDIIKEKAEDPTRYGYRTSELNYLVRIAEKVPAKVVNIMLAVPVSAETFNPEVIDRFLWICSSLPAEQLARVVQKVRDEKWIPLMGVFNQWGFDYEKMLRALADTKDYKSVLVLAEAILAMRTKEEIEKTTNRIATDNPFYFDDLSYTKVFEYLASVAEEYAEQAFDLVTEIMAKIVLLGGNAESGEVFPVEETFHLFDVDFFTLELGKKDRLSHRDDVRELTAVIKVLANRLISRRCTEVDAVRKLYRQYIEPLPQSRSMWRLRLFVLSLCPKVFESELKDAFFRLFRKYPYYEIISGTEYEKALRLGFPVLSEDDKRKYICQVFEYFSRDVKDSKEQKWNKQHGWEILSSICEQLTEEEKAKCEEIFGKKCDAAYEPEPSIGKIRGGMIKPKAPLTLEEFSKLSIADIAKKLRNEWSPEKLREQNTSDDFLNPLNAEGVGELLRADIARRTQDYVTNAKLLFERGVLDQHYTYSLFRGLQEAIRNNKVSLQNTNWDGLIALCLDIKKSAEEKFFEQESKKRREVYDSWLSDWAGVHSALADVLQEILSEDDGKIIIDFSKYRNELFAILGYLLAYPDPKPAEEKIESASMTTGAPYGKESFVSDPFTMAINSVRGRAFQALTLFVYQDGKQFKKEDKIKLSADVKELYETVLQNEETRAIMFMFGHYLPSFYFRDKEWIQKLLPQIFPTVPEKKNLYSAAWEGYLANNLYEEIFFDSNIQKLYERAITLKISEDDTKQKYFKDPDEGIAIHLALALIVYYKKFDFSHPLFKAFWGKDDTKQHAYFVSFIGRKFISGDNAKANELLEKEPQSKERLKDLWDLILKKYTDPELFTEFGFWINLEKDIFDIPWLAERVKKTLEKANGFLEWDYGLTKSITAFAKEAAEDALAIARLYFWNGGIKGGERRRPFHIDNEWLEVFKILYNNPLTKKGTYTLIDDLIREGGSTFWGLKEVLKDEVPSD